MPLRFGVGRRPGRIVPLTSPENDPRRRGTCCGGQHRCGAAGAPALRILCIASHPPRRSVRHMHGGCMEGGMAFLRTLRAASQVCVVGALATFLLASAAAQAQGDAATVVVTATRTSQSIDDALTSVTVITRADIQARQAASVQELLTGEAGVQISNNGGLGKATALFLRGTEADQVLVLVDGVKLTSATLGTTAFEYLPVEEIDRIEIVRGPRSSLYGSEAGGGGIQIFTRRGQSAAPFTATPA